MGFGSGGGFNPSRNVVPGSTIVGSDIDADLHHFTGSVEITGSLTLNGSSITGGGGGTPGGSNTQVQYNDGGAFAGASGLVYDDGNDRVGVGTTSPTAKLHVSSSADGETVFQVDAFFQANQGFSIVDSAGAAYATINKTAQSTYPLDVGGNIRANAYLSTVNGTGYGFRVGQNLNHLYVDSGTQAVTFDVKLGQDLVLITGSGGNLGVGTSAPLQTLSVSGSAAFSGAFGSTSIQTIDVTDGLVNNTSGVTIVDATGLSNNAFYTYGIEDGVFTGQRKDLLFKCNFAGAIATTNGAEVTGSNIDVAQFGTTVGKIILSGSDAGGGHFQYLRGSAQLLWDGTEWQVLSAQNAQYSGA